MWQLKANGDFGKTLTNVMPDFVVDPETVQPATLTEIFQVGRDTAGQNTKVAIQFHVHTDGRGFSLAKRLSALGGHNLNVVAVGNLIPDQARLAFQSGFDAIEIEDALVMRHGEQAWRSALEKSTPTLYFQCDSNSKSVYKYKWNSSELT